MGYDCIAHLAFGMMIGFLFACLAFSLAANHFGNRGDDDGKEADDEAR